MSVAAVLIAEEEFALSKEAPFVFGRADEPGVVGLDAADMGISTVAGAVEWDRGLWWVVNHSRKRPLLLDSGAGSASQRLECGHTFAISVTRLSVLVAGAIFTHRLEVVVPEAELALVRQPRPSTGTITAADIRLSERDKDALVALLSGYLEDFPRRQPRPRTYREAAERLGEPWTDLTVRKQVERLKGRLQRSGRYIEGPQANFELAEYLIGNRVLTPADLARLPPRR